MRKYLILGLGVIVAFLCIKLSILTSKYNSLNDSYRISKSNEKALLDSNSDYQNRIGVLQLSVEQLNYFNDSILNKMTALKKELKIKDQNIKQLQYFNSQITRKDSIVFIKDTIFKDVNLHIDTLFKDKWYTLGLELKYPNKIIVEPTFISEMYAFIHMKKETIDPPKKFFIARWFQKKHKVIRVEIKEENPHITLKNSKFVQIIK